MLNIAGLELVVIVGQLLAGFAITIAAQLLATRPRDKFVSTGIGLLICTAILLLTSTYQVVLLLNWTKGLIQANDPGINAALGNVDSNTIFIYNIVANISSALSLLGSLAFLAAIAIIGWIRSKAVGIITTIMASTAVIIMIGTNLLFQ